MPPKRFELRVLRGGRPVEGATFVAVLDLTDILGTRDLLERHIYAVCDRVGERRDRAHLFVLEVRETDSDGKGTGEVLHRVALPVEPQR